MDAPPATVPAGSHTSAHAGPPLQPSTHGPGRTRPAPVPGLSVGRGGGPSAFGSRSLTPRAQEHESALARCVGDVDHFDDHVWGRRAVVRASDSRDTGSAPFDDVFSLDELDRMLATAPRVPEVRMVIDGAPLSPSSYCSPTRLGGRDLDDVVDPVMVAARLQEGATLVMQSVHRTSPSVGDFVGRLQEEISHPVQANAYLTPPQAVGLVAHADLHDVFAIQLHGRKQWWVDGIGDVELHPGDVMYIPSGVRHSAETMGETSLHLTIGVIRVTYRQAIERFLRAGSESLDLPLPIGYRLDQGDDRLERGLDEALDSALDVIGSADVCAIAERERSRRFRRPERPGRVASVVQVESVDLDTMISWVAAEPLARAIDDADGRAEHWDGLRSNEQWSPGPERVAVDLGDRCLTLPVHALDALRMLSGECRVRVGDLPGLDEAGRLVLAKRLVREAACIIEV